jgi:uncharacterized membrane protein
VNSSGSHLSLTQDPAYPWSISGVGLPALILVALALAGMTIWTYLGVPGATRRRVMIVLGLRLAALIIAILALLRPSFAYRDDLRTPSLLLIDLDASASMTVQDEIGSQSRWARMQTILRQCESTFDELRDKHNIQVVFSAFAGDVSDYDPSRPPDGKRTDFGFLLNQTLERYRGEKFLRGKLILSDGADNGARFQPLSEATQWRTLPCPIHTFGLGKESTSDRQNDIALVAINPAPSPVPIKGEVGVRVIIDAPGFENKDFNPHVFFDDVEVPSRIFIDEQEIIGQKPRLKMTQGNEVTLKCTAPATPGEVKVTVKIDHEPGDVNRNNDEISTYLTVTKEGISILMIEAFGRHPEPQRIISTLSRNPRFRMFVAWFGTNDVSDPSQQDLLNFDKQPYDVIILGDVTPQQVKAGTGDPKIFKTIRDLVAKGTGLIMLGGRDSLGNSSWRETELAEIMPVELNGATVAEGGARGIKMMPLTAKLDQFVVRLADNKDDNIRVWEDLFSLSSINKVTPKKGATVLTETEPGKDPILVWWQPPNCMGRVMAFGTDSTNRWVRDLKGLAAYTRFWEQMGIWLARQEETDSNIKVKLKARRLPAGDPAEFFDLNLLDKTGKVVPGARFDIKVTDPQGHAGIVPSVHDKDGDKGSIWKTDMPGEYRLEITGRGAGADGAAITGSLAKPVRFIVYQDDAESVRRGADHDFLKKLAEAGGGEFHRIDELREFLKKQYADQPLPQAGTKTNVWPDWRKNTTSPFLPLFFLLFVGLLTLEWFLRRRWGLI